jgi:hypothetical protein
MQRYLGLNWKFLTFLEIETMNKFEALKMFQGWPPEWQRLCAEYWIETGEDRPTQVWTTADKIQTAGELVQRGVTLPMPGDPWPFDQPKAAKVAAVSTKKTHVVNSRESTGFTLDELQYAQKGIAVGIKDCLLAEDMAGRFGRTKKAFQNYISLIHRNGIDLSTGRKKPHGVQY